MNEQPQGAGSKVEVALDELHDGASGHSEYGRSSNGQLRMPGYNMSVVVAGMTGQDGRPDLTKRGE